MGGIRINEDVDLDALFPPTKMEWSNQVQARKVANWKVIVPELQERITAYMTKLVSDFHEQEEIIAL
jgi:hypothetical protein